MIDIGDVWIVLASVIVRTQHMLLKLALKFTCHY